METIDPKKFLELAKPVMKTDYYKNADWEGDALSDIVDNLEENLNENYDYDDVVYAVESLIAADKTHPLPKALRVLVEYVYGIAVKRCDASRINDYGSLYYDGRLGEQDFNKAAYFYRKAAKLGDSNAVVNLGYIFYYGREGEVDYEKAFQCFSIGSVAYGSSIATYKLGDMFKNGYYVRKDLTAAFNCYLRAEKIERNNDNDELDYEPTYYSPMPDIKFRLAECYHNGIGTDVNLNKALAYYQKAEQGFIGKVREGNYFVKKMLIQSIECQNKILNEIAKDLPQMEWAKQNIGYKTI